MYTRQIPSHLNLSVGSIMDKQQETAGPTFGLELSGIQLMTVTTDLNATQVVFPPVFH